MKRNFYTPGGINVENIKVGDIHYEYEYGAGIKVEVLTVPVRSDQGYWTWKSRNVFDHDHIIDYGLHENYPHYGPKLYEHEEYTVTKFIGEK
jgi:hypothetical protein